jgi:type II secretory pathway pseudopilin PulG
MTRGSRARGYTLVALLVGVTVMSVLIASVVPLASAEAQRDREEELIFRGRQYAEGIRVFRRRFGRYPNTLKELHELKPRSIRKLWKEPISNTDVWGLLSIANAGPGPGGAPQQGATGLTPRPTPTPVMTSGSGSPGMPGGAPAPVAAITGVYSLSKKKSYRIYDGRDVYNEWRFTEQSLFGGGATGNNETPNGLPGPGFGGGPPGGGGR